MTRQTGGFSLVSTATRQPATHFLQESTGGFSRVSITSLLTAALVQQEQKNGQLFSRTVAPGDEIYLPIELDDVALY